MQASRLRTNQQAGACLKRAEDPRVRGRQQRLQARHRLGDERGALEQPVGGSQGLVVGTCSYSLGMVPRVDAITSQAGFPWKHPLRMAPAEKEVSRKAWTWNWKRQAVWGSASEWWNPPVGVQPPVVVAHRLRHGPHPLVPVRRSGSGASRRAKSKGCWDFHKDCRHRLRHGPHPLVPVGQGRVGRAAGEVLGFGEQRQGVHIPTVGAMACTNYPGPLCCPGVAMRHSTPAPSAGPCHALVRRARGRQPGQRRAELSQVPLPHEQRRQHEAGAHQGVQPLPLLASYQVLRGRVRRGRAGAQARGG